MRGDETIKRALEERAAEEKRRSAGATRREEEELDRALEEGASRDEPPAPRDGRPPRRR